MGGKEAEAVVAVYLGYHGGDLVKCRGSEGVQEAVAETKHVGGEAVDPVSVDAAEVSEHEGFCYNDCIFGRDAIAF